MTTPHRTVLLTGSTGFLGSHLLRALCASGHVVVALKRSTSDARRIAGLLHEAVVYDVDRLPLRSIFEAHQIDAVIHTATCYEGRGASLGRLVESNLTFPLAVLELCLEFNVRTFISTGTALPAQLNFYALSKSQFAEYGRRVSSVEGLCFIDVRVEHLYGPGDHPARFIPTIIRAFLKNQPRMELTAGEQRRDFLFIEDAVAAFLTLLRSRERIAGPCAAFELGSGKAPPLADVVRLAHRLCGGDTELAFGALEYRESEVMYSQANLSSLGNLGWTPRVSLADGLRLTILAETGDRVT